MSGWTRTDNVLVLDEPTASLSGDEIGVLFAAVRQVALDGAGVVFISHRLEEVTELADRVVVLRDGRQVADRPAAGLDADGIAALITGRERSGGTPPAGSRPGPDVEPALIVRGLRGPALEHFDLDLSPGEIVGIAGSLGSGREQIAGLLYGQVARLGGEVVVNGRPIRSGSPRAARRAGVAFIPPDRHAHGGATTHSVSENLVLPDLRSVTSGVQLSRRRSERRRWTGLIASPSSPSTSPDPSASSAAEISRRWS